MNITEAKQIPLSLLVEQLGGRHSHDDRRGDKWYFSPFRPDEKTASFKINTKTNTWHDFGMVQTFGHRLQGSGGDIIDLWCDYVEKDRKLHVPDALIALGQYRNSAWRGERLRIVPANEKLASQVEKPRYKIVEIANQIIFNGLKDELDRRRISLKLADMYLKQGHILDTVTNKTYTGFLFENDKGGYEASIPKPNQRSCFKTCIGSKASSRILTSSEKTNSADVFEGYWDFLSWLEWNKRYVPIHHSYVLNSTSMTSEVCEKIKAFEENIDFVFLFMDNDIAGHHATSGFMGLLEPDYKVGSFAKLYEGYKDLNEFWMDRPISP